MRDRMTALFVLCSAAFHLNSMNAAEPTRTLHFRLIMQHVSPGRSPGTKTPNVKSSKP